MSKRLTQFILIGLVLGIVAGYVVNSSFSGSAETFAARVELLDTGVLAGDVKAGSLTVAAGSRMRGQVEFGWAEQAARSIKGEVAAS